MSQSFPQYLSNVFDTQNLEEVREKPPSRRKRPHQKSRNGCSNCKRRKVKCDEGYPSCKRCIQREDTCCRSPRQRPIPERSMLEPSKLSSTPLLSSPISTLKSNPINLEDMHLFHHFQTHTNQTLPLIAPVWKDAVRLAFEYDHLMHAVLCVSARHLSFLHAKINKCNKYTTLSRKHLSHALRSYRNVLSDQTMKLNQDATLCTSALIFCEAWSDMDIFLPETCSARANSNDLLYFAPDDQLLNLVNGVRYVFSTYKWQSLDISSIFESQLIRRPIVLVKDFSLSVGRDPSFYANHLAAFYNNPELILNQVYYELPDRPELAQHRDLNSIRHDPTKWHDQQVCSQEAFMDVARRLSVLLSLLPSREDTARGDAKSASILDVQSDILGDVSRVVFTFSIMFHQRFMNMLFDNDPRAHFLLYHFYRAVDILLPKQECWWASRRAEVMRNSLARKLWGELNSAMTGY
ncbi:hypothetical protein BGW36DRAFT_368863 [Talaromyces proteolyticus]|uniref:Zn(2)-C6 fungal-type domain-containing protein n=1 Tax=Talaromyces proteolyticus TaxID=1131652 RepID=A0AAD4Q4K9_9EURO|nr:uncharacterized protein BGW36DRAFT_368863 [Talaromyces proteolyticus]KAH8703130.1 hypothetical protein BGW36DRAFT_368863 [Talaromyces proteolyticus]